MPYSEKWRNHRREIHHYFNQHQTPEFKSIQMSECHAFLRRALESPDQLGQHLRLCVILKIMIRLNANPRVSLRIFTAVILKIVYDMDIDDIRDDYVRLGQEAVYGISVNFVPGLHLAEYFPILQYIPTWFPGTSFRRSMEHYRPIVQEMRNRPYDKILADMVRYSCFKSTSMLTDMCTGYRRSNQIINERFDRTFTT